MFLEVMSFHKNCETTRFFTEWKAANRSGKCNLRIQMYLGVYAFVCEFYMPYFEADTHAVFRSGRVFTDKTSGSILALKEDER